MALDVVLLHSALGLRPAVLRAADRLRAAGHRVQAPDLYDGRVFDDVDEGVAHLKSVGFASLVARAEALDVPAGAVFGGWSMGAGLATHLVQTRGDARGGLMLHGGELEEGDPWPGVPLAVHHAADDPWVEKPYRDTLLETAAASGAQVSLHVYPGTGHVFDDDDHADSDPAAAALLWSRVEAWLAELDR